MMGRKLIVVLGMHRSGTSAITRGLQVVGVDLGSRLVPAMAGNNSKGFWEDFDILGINIEMLDFLKREWSHLTPISSDDIRALISSEFFPRAVDLLHQKVSDCTVFGFKDPRLAVLLPFWKEVFSHCQFNVSYVLAVRHPLSVVRSLAKRDGLDATTGYLLWLSHVIPSLSATVNENRVLVDYDCQMDAPDDQLKRIAKYLNLTVNNAELDAYKAEFLDEALRHTVYEPTELLLDDACPILVREVYSTLLDVAANNIPLTDPALHKTVQHWADEFERITSLLALADRLSAQNTVSKQAIAERDNQVASLSQDMAERDNRIVSLSQDIAERDNRIVSLSQAIAEGDNQINTLTAEIGEIKKSKSWKVMQRTARAMSFFRRT